MPESASGEKVDEKGLRQSAVSHLPLAIVFAIAVSAHGQHQEDYQMAEVIEDFYPLCCYMDSVRDTHGHMECKSSKSQGFAPI